MSTQVMGIDSTRAYCGRWRADEPTSQDRDDRWVFGDKQTGGHLLATLIRRVDELHGQYR